MSADLDAIKRRWSTEHDRGAHDYTDAGCRVLAEHAFKDVAWLAARAERLGAALKAERVQRTWAFQQLRSWWRGERRDLSGSDAAIAELDRVERSLVKDAAPVVAPERPEAGAAVVGGED